MRSGLSAVLLFICISAHAADKDITSLIEQASETLSSKDSSKISKLVGNIGALIVPFGGDYDNPDHNNGYVFAKEFKSVLGKSKPVCFGYNLSSTKTIVFFKAPGIDWSKSSLQNVTTDNFALHFYRWPKSTVAWQLIWVTPVSQEDIQSYGSLTPCYEAK